VHEPNVYGFVSRFTAPKPALGNNLKRFLLMNALLEIRLRFAIVFANYPGLTGSHDELLQMIRPAQDTKFGDYQANCAMPLAGKLGKQKNAREVAAELVAALAVSDLCQSVEIAGPGFINLKLSDQWLKEQIQKGISDSRLGIEVTANPRCFVVDYSSPNVAKPMHVGHIRSTVIGDALAKTLRFLGHRVISDNHLGDWGTQFGMIIYGYKHFVDARQYEEQPVAELGRIYKLVRKLMDYHDAVEALPAARDLLIKQQDALQRVQSAPANGDKKAEKTKAKDIEALNTKMLDQRALIAELTAKVDSVNQSPPMLQLAHQHSSINSAVLQETSMLHAGDATNLQLWHEFLPHCREDIQRIYQRLDIQFDYELGESFYHNQLQSVVDDFEAKGFARTSEGAVCVFLDNYTTPMIIQKKDGAFLYSTSDLATIKYRLEEWHADVILYVVDHRQHEHFEKLFDAARLWGYTKIDLQHVSFGTVLGDDGKPYKTRSGDTVGLEGLLDEAESRALRIAMQENPNLSEAQQRQISRVVGIGGLKYADLSQNRSSDYKFSYDKMLALKGNTATYLQYSYARVQGILRKLDVDPLSLRANPKPIEFSAPIERQLTLKLLQFGEALDEMLLEYKPNVLCSYLFELTQTFFQFYDQCSVKDAATNQLRTSRLQLCDLFARTVKTGLSLLGIQVLDQM
jgi:arginyl-tRNA synthetase